MTQDSTHSKEIKKKTELSDKEKKQRKHQVLTQGHSSITRSIAEAIVIKNENIFFLTLPDGNVPLGDSHGYGLYYHDCRYLNGYQLTLANTNLNPLVAAAPSGDSAIFELTNPELMIWEGEHISSAEIGLTWERALDGQNNILRESIRIKNYGNEAVKLPLSLTFQAGFEDVFAIRGLLSEQPGKLHPPEWKGGELIFLYDGADGRYRSLSIQFSMKPSQKNQGNVQFDLMLEPKKSREIKLTLSIEETEEKSQLHWERSKHNGRKQSSTSSQSKEHLWFDGQGEYKSDSLLLNEIIDSSLRDLHMLITSIDELEFFAAGVPWFATLFGRDSLITGLQTLAIQPEIAAQTLRLLAKFQAHDFDQWRDAQPGKILHELRIGELARLGEIPYTPYYGTVDATPLFLVLLASYTDWKGDLSLFNELRDTVEAALTWIDQYGDADHDSYIEYHNRANKGLINQGWKDSGEAIVDAHGRLAKPPISLVEVQGYVYRAKTGLAALFARAGENKRAEQLRKEAEELHAKFNQDFWLEEKGIYTLALEENGKPLRVVSSNAGHALWSGIAEPEKAKRTAERLMENDMFNGWGIRTLSSAERGYNPTGYHLGTVWPHDSAMIAVGFRRYGFDQAAERIMKGILEAAMNFKSYRLPELFAGFSRDDYSVPVHYPVACHPQAWAAGSIPYLISSFLGLAPEAFEERLRIRRPMLPDFVGRLQVHQLRVGNAKVDLHYERQADGKIKVEVIKVDGKLEVITS